MPTNKFYPFAPVESITTFEGRIEKKRNVMNNIEDSITYLTETITYFRNEKSRIEKKI